MENQAQRNSIHLQEMQTLAVKAKALFLNLEQFLLLVQDLAKDHQAIRRCITTSDQELDQVEQTLAILLLVFIFHQELLPPLASLLSCRLSFVLPQETDQHQETALLVETQQGCTLHQEVQAYLEAVPNQLMDCMFHQEQQVLLETETNFRLQYILCQGLQVIQLMAIPCLVDFTRFQDQQVQMVKVLKAQLDCIRLQEAPLPVVLEIQATSLFITTSGLEQDPVERILEIQQLGCMFRQEQHLLQGSLLNHQHRYTRCLGPPVLQDSLLIVQARSTLRQEVLLHPAMVPLVVVQQDSIQHQEVLLLLQLEDLLQSVFMYLLEVQPQKEMVPLAMELLDYTHRQGRLALKVADLQIQANFAQFLFLLLLLQVDPAQQADFMSRQEPLLPMVLLVKMRTGCTRRRGHQAILQTVHQVHQRCEQFQEMDQINLTEIRRLMV
jgi:hypothetical protein